ncbi:LuxR C-terminal-related transcriptional regulator [Thalassotalea psychrophila]|uniref:LuxR C-terminal-related transcriptional regulator n=1 Tax=Thalassotalea psychrophila TaxID=3065647 RepID=A0ABY9U053_9GAMM|nr:LuxR C-terminal-related transcriptional regulator [Colwelliaceae bacterium SQ149]
MLTSNTIPPKLGADTIVRKRILDRINNLPSHCKVVVLQAPAGYGKTTVMRQYFQQLKDQQENIAWLTLSETDNDLTPYLRSLSRLVSRGLDDTFEVPEHCESPFHWLQDVIAKVPKPFYVFLDEFEVLNEPGVIEFINRGFKLVPADCKTIISCRGMPDFSLSRMLLSGEAVVFKQEDLCFQEDEAQCFVDNRLTDDTQQDVKTAFISATQRWPAAMQLGFLAFGDSNVNADNIPKLLLNDPLVSDYVVQNVLSTLPVEHSDFLLTSCCLNKFDVRMCNAVIGIENSQEILQEILAKGVFLQPIDYQRQWYSYHKLFAELLRRELQLSRPGYYQQVCKKAAEWCADNSYDEEAIEYAFAADEIDFACLILEKHLASLLFDARINAITRWIHKLENVDLMRHPNIIFVGCWANILNADISNAEQKLALLDEMPSEQRAELPLIDAYDITKLSFYLMKDDIPAFNQAIDKVVNNKRSDHPFSLLGFANLNTFKFLLNGKVAKADKWIKSQFMLRKNKSNLISEVYFDFMLSLIYVSQGQLELALKELNSTEATFIDDIARLGFHKALVAPIRAMVLYEQNDIDNALSILEGQITHLRQYKTLDLVALTYITLSRCYATKKDFKRAVSLLEEAERCGYNEGWSRLVVIALWEQVRLATLSNNLVHAEQLLFSLMQDESLNSINLVNLIPADLEHADITKYRLNIALNQSEPSAAQLLADIDLAILDSRHYRVLKLKVLLVSKLHSENSQVKAEGLLKDLLQQFVPLGFMRSFIDEGPVIFSYIQNIAKQGGECAIMAKQVLASVGDQFLLPSATTVIDINKEAKTSVIPLIEPLTQRELEIISLLVNGESNRSIADNLFVSEGTIKWHLGNIYGKLGVKKRTQAMVRVNELKLI